jgi:hypothetical protein
LRERLMTNNRKTRTVATAVGVAVLGGVCFFAPAARSADHRDSDANTADPTADINDVYTFLDGTNFVMAMTVFPFAAAKGVDGGSPAASFSNAVQYVFHTASGKVFGTTTATEDVICTFKSATNISCWVGTDDYVTGDPSDPSKPLTSASKKLQVFAGLRGDPFHFDLQGFKDVEGIYEGIAATTPVDGSACPDLSATQVTAVVGTLAETSSVNNASKTVADDFATANSLAIVVSVDSSLVTKGGSLVSVWAATLMP